MSRGLASSLELQTLLAQSQDAESSNRDLEAVPSSSPASKKNGAFGVQTTLLAGLSYCAASTGMVLLNKFALSSFSFNEPTSLLFFQCSFSLMLVMLCSFLGVVRLEPFNLRVARVWFPVNVIFVGMIWTSFYSLQRLGVPMVTVLKNLTNLLIIAGDYLFFNKKYNVGVWIALLLIIVSAVCGAVTDLAFDFQGYMWQLVNCVFTATYSLYLRGVMDKVKNYTSNKQRLDEFSMVAYNNALSLPLLLILMFVKNEFSALAVEPALTNPAFQLAAVFSGLLGFAISFASLWFLATTTATTYSLVGSLNKLPVAFLGLFFFESTWSFKNVGSVLVGCIAGVVFVKAKAGSR